MLAWLQFAFVAGACLAPHAAGAEGLCAAVKPASYALAKTQYPHLKAALEVVEAEPIATWYTDRDPDSKHQAALAVGSCSRGNRPTIVVYGLPQKDCQDHQSSGGANQTPVQYERFLQDLVTTVGDNHVIYVLEPDALGLLVGGSACAVAASYERNLGKAVALLGANPKADIYLDVGFWILGRDRDAAVATVLAKLDPGRRLKGIAINTSNFRSTPELAQLCGDFAHAALAATNRSLSCVLDVSRNYQGPDPASQWCNPTGRGIGHPPSMVSGLRFVDYLLWIKPPGESDGNCNGGPAAGQFFADAFVGLWNNGYFVHTQGLPPLNTTRP
nr:secreted protein [Achlya hypogyna]